MDDMNHNGTLVARSDFSSTEGVMAATDTAATSAAAQAKAMVEARYIMALRRPRNWDDVRLNLLKECRRPSFAHNKSSLYHKPIGKGVEGLGIRFVEVALRCMSNVLIDTITVFEDDRKELLVVNVTDLESNLTYNHPVKVSKTVERSRPLDDGSYISVRKNSYGKDSYTVPASDDDLLNKRGALISKAIRTLGARIIPGDLQDEAEKTIRAIRIDKAAQDPDAERKSLADGFMAMGVHASSLAEYLGHDIGTCSPAELVKLRGLYGAIRDGETTWKAALESVADANQAAKSGAAADKLNKTLMAEQNGEAEKQMGSPSHLSEWPIWDEDAKNWFDADRVYYDKSAHAGRDEGTAPKTNADGTFKAKRGYAHLAKKLSDEAKARHAAAKQASPPQPAPDKDSGATDVTRQHTVTPHNDRAKAAAGEIGSQEILVWIRQAETLERMDEIDDLIRELPPGTERTMCENSSASKRRVIEAGQA